MVVLDEERQGIGYGCLTVIVALIFCGWSVWSMFGDEEAEASIVLNPQVIQGVEENVPAQQPAQQPVQPDQAPRQPPIEFAGGEIAFISEREGNVDIWAVDLKTLKERRITDHSARDLYPDWSPDGSRIVFTTQRDGNDEIYIMNADGSELVRLTDHSAVDTHPSWSRDGTKIAFSSYRNGNADIYTMNVDESGLTQITDDPGNQLSPDWGISDLWLGFEAEGKTGDSDRPDNVSVFIIRSNVPDRPRRMSDGEYIDRHYRYSPDAQSVVFYSLSKGTDYFLQRREAHIMRPTKLGLRGVTPNWSPDGRYIVYASDPGRDGQNYQIYIANQDGTNPVQLTDNGFTNWWPVWSPR